MAQNPPEPSGFLARILSRFRGDEAIPQDPIMPQEPTTPVDGIAAQDFFRPQEPTHLPQEPITPGARMGPQDPVLPQEPTIDIDVPAFGAGTADAADSDGETSTTDGRDDIAVTSFSDTTDEPGTGPVPIGGYRAEWRPSDGASDGASDTFDPTDPRAGADVSFGTGAIDAQLHIADDVKYSNDAADPGGDGPHEVDIGGNLDEPTEIWLGPAESPPDDGAVTEVSDTDAPLAATDSTKFEDVD